MLSDSSEKNNFDLLHEIGKEGTYRLLFPPPQAGLAILNLYQKVRLGLFPNGRFRESDINSALESSKLVINTEEYDRLPHIKFNEIISDLQVYFLRYDTDEQLYTLKEYAESFCRYAEETLLDYFNPTQIEIICNELRIKLEGCNDQYEVKDWIDTFFINFKPGMKGQVDRLERQIDKTVQEIRATTQLADTSILDVLKAIDEKLDTLREQNEELRSAFREMKTINLMLEERLAGVTENFIADSIAEVRQFFPEIKYTLGLIDKRLDRIQPKLRQFFGMLNKPSFNIRIDNFLKFLLTKSTLSPQKEVILPIGIPTFQFIQKTIDFTIFERREDLFPTKPKPRIKPIENPEEKEKGLAVAKKQLSMYTKVDYWVDEILVAAADVEVSFSAYFFQILELTDGGIELSLNVAYSLIRRVDVDSRLDLEMTTERIKHPRQNISLWEMKIRYRK